MWFLYLAFTMLQIFNEIYDLDAKTTTFDAKII